MTPFLTKTRIAFLVLVVLIIGSLVGANKYINGQRHLGAPNRDPAEKAEKSVANNTQRAGGVVAMGIVSPEGNIVPLTPSVKGEVREVLVKEDQQVKKDQLLLKMDDRLARADVKRAENAVEAAELLAEKAQRGMKEWEVGVELLKLKLKAARKDYARAYNLVESLTKVVESKSRASAEDELKDARLQAEKALIAIDAADMQLKEAENKKPTVEGKQAESAVKEAKLQLEKAKLGLDFCELRAPADGTIMQSFVSPGSKFGDQVVKPAFFFYTGGIVVKADVNQEWAYKVKEGMVATMEDTGGSGLRWKGRVYYVARSFLPKRDAAGALEGVNLLQQNQELVLECRIALDPDQPAPFLNQKVRVHIGQ